MAVVIIIRVHKYEMRMREVIVKYCVIRFVFDKMWRVLSKILTFLVWGVFLNIATLISEFFLAFRFNRDKS